MAVNISGSILKGITVSSSVAGNPYYPYVVLQLNCLGAVNSQVFLDTSSSPKTVSALGDTKISDALVIQSGYFDGVFGDYLTANNADLNMNSSDYQMQAWVYLDVPDEDTNRYAILSSYNGIQADGRWVVWVDSKKLTFSEQDGNGVDTGQISSPGDLPLRQRVHVAASKAGTTMRLFINGMLVASGTSSIRTGFTNEISVGAFEPSYFPNAWYWKGYIGPLELYKGIVTYTSNFTPLPGPFPDFA